MHSIVQSTPWQNNSRVNERCKQWIVQAERREYLALMAGQHHQSHRQDTRWAAIQMKAQMH
jgi:hypothetical protein